MKNMLKTITCALLVFTFLGSTVVAVASPTNEATITPRFNNIASIITGLDISLNGKATCWTGVTLYSIANCTCTIEMTLQQSDDESNWDDLKTWTISGGNDTDIEKYRYVDSGYYYRVESTTFVYNSNGTLVETATTHSPTWEY